MKLKAHLILLFLFASMLGMTPAQVKTDSQNVKYLDTTDGDKEKTAENVRDVEQSMSTGWYAVTSNQSFDDDHMLSVNGDVNLILCNGATLTAEDGINVPASSKLTIWGQKNHEGKLVAEGDDYNAGIGGTEDGSCGDIIINGGTINATGVHKKETRSIPLTGADTDTKTGTDTKRILLVAKGIAKSSNMIKISWKKVNGADRYVIYFTKCSTNKYKAVKTVNGNTSSWTKRRLKYTNPKALKLKKTTFTIREGGKAKISAKIKKVKSGKKLLTGHGPKLKYSSTDPGTAKVDSKGNISGVRTGKCTIYVQTINGIWKALSVTVK